MPFVSVILCTYNGEQFIDDQIRSILSQTHKDLEIIISDDASTDGTAAKLQQWSLTDHRIKLFRQDTNLGFNRNFEFAIARASHSYISISDQDDLWHEEKIEVLLKALLSDDNNILAHAPSLTFRKLEDTKRLKNGMYGLKVFSGNDIRKILFRNPISGHNMLFRKTLFELSIPFPPDFFYDWWLVYKACLHGNIVAVNRILTFQRLHEFNATATVYEGKRLIDHVLIFSRFLVNQPDFPREHKAFGDKLVGLFAELNHRPFSARLFSFLVANGRTFFWQKKKKFPWFSYIKHSWRQSRADFFLYK